MIELVKANGYDTKKKLSEKDNFLIADSITCAKVIKDIEELNIIRPDFRRDLI
jgi:hypothetical protein